MQFKIMCRKGDLPLTLEPKEAEAVFDRLTGRSTESLPQPVLDRMGDQVKSIPGIETDGLRLNYAVFREVDHRKINAFGELKPEDSVLLVPPIAGG